MYTGGTPVLRKVLPAPAFESAWKLVYSCFPRPWGHCSAANPFFGSSGKSVFHLVQDKGTAMSFPRHGLLKNVDAVSTGGGLKPTSTPPPAFSHSIWLSLGGSFSGVARFRFTGHGPRYLRRSQGARSGGEGAAGVVSVRRGRAW